MRRLHQDWGGREGELRQTPDLQSPGSRALELEQALVFAISQGTSWISPPDKLARLAELVLTKVQSQQIESWIKQWKQGRALIQGNWFPEESRRFSLLQYGSLTEDQLRSKLAQFPRGTELLWQFWPPGQISPPVSMAVQDTLYEQMRHVAEKNGVILLKANHP